MIRVVFFFSVVAMLALGEAWLADRPGNVTIVWLGYRIETSVMILASALLALAALAVMVWSLVRTLMRSPGLLALFLHNRRSARGYLAVSRGLIAVGAGDAVAARRFAQQAARLAPADPLALLLAAQSAQLSGDRADAEQAFRIMLGRPDTKLFGLHGLYIEAQRRNDMLAARAFAEEAARTAPSLAWAGQAALEFHCSARDWAGALAALERNMKSGLVSKAVYRRQRAVLLTARAMMLEENERDSAKTLALEAAKLAPELVPAAALAGRLLGDAGEIRKAGRVIEDTWRANPHPDLAESFAYLKPGDSARDRLARVQALARKPDGHIEGALAVARSALDAREFAVARSTLAPLIAAPTRRVAMLMAELEEEEHGDTGRAREWMARALNAARDPAWTADGLVSDRWLPVSPLTGRLDAFEWRVPLAELPAERPIIEEHDVAIAAPSEPAPLQTPANEAANEKTPSAPPAGAQAARKSSPPRTIQPVIPLVHAPDDPGPEPAPEPARVTSGWRRLRSLFASLG